MHDACEQTGVGRFIWVGCDNATADGIPASLSERKQGFMTPTWADHSCRAHSTAAVPRSQQAHHAGLLCHPQDCWLEHKFCWGQGHSKLSSRSPPLLRMEAATMVHHFKHHNKRPTGPAMEVAVPQYHAGPCWPP